MELYNAEVKPQSVVINNEHSGEIIMPHVCLEVSLRRIDAEALRDSK